MNTTAPSVGDLNEDQTLQDNDLAPQCPDCGSTTPWRGSSWCPDCGYYPAIADHVVKEEPAETIEEEPQANKSFSLSFFQKLNIGIFGIFVLTALVRTYYFYADADRAIWTLLQVTIGVVTAGTAQFLTAVYATKEDHHFSLASAIINPFEIWGPSIRNNVYQNRLCALVWGITATVLAFVMIGGLTEDHFFKAIKRDKKPDFNVVKSIVEATEGVVEGEGEEDDAIEAHYGTSADNMKAHQNILSCSIYGYMTNGGDTITRILLAAQNDDGMQHVGILTAEQLGDEKTRALTNMLSTLEVPETSVKTSFLAKWVEPSFTIAIQHDGFDAFGNLKNVRIPEKKEKEAARK